MSLRDSTSYHQICHHLVAKWYVQLIHLTSKIVYPFKSTAEQQSLPMGGGVTYSQQHKSRNAKIVYLKIIFFNLLFSVEKSDI